MEYSAYQNWYTEMLNRFHLTGTLKATTKDTQVVMLNDIYHLSLTRPTLRNDLYTALSQAESPVALLRAYKNYLKHITYETLMHQG